MFFKKIASKVNCLLTDHQATADDVVALVKCLSWPCDKVFPALDVLRLAVLHPSSSKLLLHPDNRENLLSLLLANLSAKVPATCQMLSLRAFSNLFSGAVSDAVGLLRAQREAIVTRAVAILPLESRPAQVALATLLLNYAVLGAGHLPGVAAEPETQAQLITSLCMLALEALRDPEAQFRALVALGTLLSADPSGNSVVAAKDMMARAGVEAWMDQAEVDGNRKVKECAQFVLGFI